MFEGIEALGNAVEQAARRFGSSMNSHPAGGWPTINTDKTRFAQRRSDGLMTEANAEQWNLLAGGFGDEMAQVCEGIIGRIEPADTTCQHNVRVATKSLRQIVVAADEDSIIGLHVLTEGIASVTEIAGVVVDYEY